MFQSARIKLTAWYLLLIMLVSISFSAAVYRTLTFELKRAAGRPRQLQTGDLPRGLPPGRPDFRDYPAGPVRPDRQRDYRGPLFPPRLDPAFVEETQKRISYALIVINLLIFGGAGGGAYFLAGRTLKPIKEMMDEQNRFIADASHELRTPITAMKTSAEVGLRDPHLSLAEAKALIKDNLEEINNLQFLSDSLLRLAEFERADRNMVFSKISLPEVLHEAQSKVSHTAKEKGITITTENAEISMYADKNSIVELLVIMLDNAIKYSPNKSEIIISSRRNENFVRIDIRDQGIGIDSRDFPHIFDRFYRADTARTKRTTAGYGLGLSIAKKIIDAHHGLISVKSVPGKGSSFTIKLPAKPACQVVHK